MAAPGPAGALRLVLEASGALTDNLLRANDSSSSSSSAGLDVTDQKVGNLLALIGSGMSFIAVVFTMVLYGHYTHLHSLANNLFIFGVLGIDLFAALAYFSCIFFVQDRGSSTFTYHQCQGCGFFEQVHSMAEPMLSFLFWAQIFCLMNRVDFVLFRSGRHLAKACAVVMAFSVLSATYVVANGWFTQDKQVWCWIRRDKLVLRVLLCWLWLCLAFAAMAVALVIPLLSDRLNAMQQRLLIRRGSLAAVSFLVNGINLVSRYFEYDSLSVLQAWFEPSMGMFNVAAFLFSERMVTLRALGLAPGAEPRYGFTAAMRCIPDKVNDNYPLL